MKVGLQICSFTWPGGPEAIGPTLARVAREADDVGFDSIWVMDHFFQIRGVGRPEEPMLEGMTALGFLAAHTERARLGLMVGGVHYRDPGLWIKATTTLDVLSRRARLAGHRGGLERGRVARPGLRLPAARRPLRAARGHAPDGPRDVAGRARLGGGLRRPPRSGRPACSTPRRACRRPRVPIMVGGGGEKKTLRLVAQYADACNVFGSPEAIARKYAILEAHCAAVGRDPSEIERSTLQNVRLGPADRSRDGDPRTRSSTASGSLSMPAPSTSSSSSRTSTSRPIWSRSAGTSCRPSTPCRSALIPPGGMRQVVR